MVRRTAALRPAHHEDEGDCMVRLRLIGLAALALASCMESDPAMKDCLRQFTEAECACLEEAIPEEKWRAIEMMANGRGLVARSRATALSLRANAEGKCGTLEPREGASTL